MYASVKVVAAVAARALHQFPGFLMGKLDIEHDSRLHNSFPASPTCAQTSDEHWEKNPRASGLLARLVVSIFTSSIRQRPSGRSYRIQGQRV